MPRHSPPNPPDDSGRCRCFARDSASRHRARRSKRRSSSASALPTTSPQKLRRGAVRGRTPLDAHELSDALGGGEEGAAVAFMHDLAALEHDDAFGGGERLARILLDQYDGDPVLPLQPLDAL